MAEQSTKKFNPCDAAIEDLVAALEAAESSGNPTAWVRGWVVSSFRNASSGSVWTGFNPLRAALHNFLGGFTDELFVTFKGAHSLGGHVRKGERGCVFIRPLIGKRTDDDGTEHVWVRGFAYFKAWNIEQCDGINPDKLAEYRVTAQGADEVPDADDVFNALGIDLKFGGGSAYYSPSDDHIVMPNRESFEGTEVFYATLFHETAHATGHKSRLNRFKVNEDDSINPYAHEELVAELSAWAVCITLGLEPPQERSVAYLQSWKKALKDNASDEMVGAMGKAREAARYILSGGQQSK